MYESAVRIIHDDLRVKQEESVLTVIQNLGIDVNKEELIKALQYDRNQYDEGYADGYEDAREDIERLNNIIVSKNVIINDLNDQNKRLVEALELLECENGPSGTPVPTDDTEIGMLVNPNDRM